MNASAPVPDGLHAEIDRVLEVAGDKMVALLLAIGLRFSTRRKTSPSGCRRGIDGLHTEK
jgi:hypothetical protein